MTDATLPQETPFRLSVGKVLPLASLPLIGMVIFLVALTNGVKGQELGMVGVAIATGLLCFVPLMMDQLRPLEKRHVLLSLICLTYALAFAVPLYTEYFLNDRHMTGMAGWAGIRGPDVFIAQVGALIGLMSLLAGYAMPVAPFFASALPEPKRDWPATWCVCVAMVLIPMGWAIFLAGQFRIVPARAGSGVLGAFASTYYFGIALLMISWLRYRSRAALILMVAAVPPTMALSFFTGSKTLFLLPLLMVAFAYIVETRKIRPSWILGGVALIVAIYPLAVFQRQIVLAGNQFNMVDVLKDPGDTLALLSKFVSSADWGEYFEAGLRATGNRFNSLGIVSIIMRDTPDRVPFQGGWSIGYIFVAYVPRIFWAGKPGIAIGQWITTNYGPGGHISSYTAPSWIGEFYMNFGYMGIVLGMLFMGFYIRLVHVYLFRRPSTIPVALGAVVAMQAMVLAVEKALSAPINGLTFKMIPVVAAHMVWIVLSGPPPKARPKATHAAGPARPVPGRT